MKPAIGKETDVDAARKAAEDISYLREVLKSARDVIVSLQKELGLVPGQGYCATMTQGEIQASNAVCALDKILSEAQPSPPASSPAPGEAASPSELLSAAKELTSRCGSIYDISGVGIWNLVNRLKEAISRTEAQQ